MIRNTHTARLLYILMTITSICYAPLSRSDMSGQVLLFPEIDSSYSSDLDKDHYEFAADIFATIEINRFRFLTEYVLSNEEQDLERFQLGLSVNKHLLWLGRTHNPIGYWNIRYHHGSFFETSISRPSIIEFEHNNGVLPMHQSGLLLEGELINNGQVIGYSLTVGAGPDLRSKLEPWDVLSPRSGTHDISTTLNLYLDSIFNNTSTVGLFVNYTKIPAKVANISEVRQTSSGIYANWDSMPWRLIVSSFYVHNDISYSARSGTDTFFSAYLQAEYTLRENWIFYSRIEGTAADDKDAYLALFPEFVEDRILGGIRYDFFSHNALKLEISGNHSDKDNFAKVMLQWSAVF